MRWSVWFVFLVCKWSNGYWPSRKLSYTKSAPCFWLLEVWISSCSYCTYPCFPVFERQGLSMRSIRLQVFILFWFIVMIVVPHVSHPWHQDESFLHMEATIQYKTWLQHRFRGIFTPCRSRKSSPIWWEYLDKMGGAQPPPDGPRRWWSPISSTPPLPTLEMGWSNLQHMVKHRMDQQKKSKNSLVTFVQVLHPCSPDLCE